MKTFACSAFLLLGPLIVSSSAQTAPGAPPPAPTPSDYVVKEFVHNSGAADWTLPLGWTWSNGVLTHFGVVDTDPAQQSAMPALTPGHAYRISLTVGASTSGSVQISLGTTLGPSYSKVGKYGYALTAGEPDALLTFTPTADYDGSISEVSVVELGDELVDASGWVVSNGWSRNADAFAHDLASPDVLSLERVVPTVSGHTYRVYFSLQAMTDPETGPIRAWLSLAGARSHPFNLNGNYSYDVKAVENSGRLVFTPEDPTVVRPFDGIIRLISVREITSDPVFSAGGSQ